MKKTLLIIGLVIIILLSTFYYLGQMGEATALEVQVVVKGNTSNPADLGNATIEDISAHLVKVKKISEPKGNPLVVPGVTVVIIQNMTMVGDWTSVPYNGTGVYNLTVGLEKYTNPGERVRVIARVLNGRSKDVDVVVKEITLV